MNEKHFNLNAFPGDVCAQLKAAGQALRENPGATLLIPAGEYLITDPRAMEILEHVFAGTWGQNPQPVMFRPDFPYTIGLDLTGCRDVTVDAYGAVFKIRGYMEPVSIRDAENVTVRGLTVDHDIKPFCRSVLTEVEEDGSGILTFDPLTPPAENMSAPREITYDPKTGGLAARFIDWYSEKEKLDETHYRMHAGFTPDEIGREFNFCTTYHFRPTVLISHSSNTRLEDVTLHNQPGMGIVGFKSRDIFIERLRIVPSPGYHVSTNTDATHFACCAGTVSIEHSEFLGHGDDAINIHNYYYVIREKPAGNRVRIRVETPDGTHSQEPDYPLAGYRLRLVDRSTLFPVDTYTVLASSEEEECEITLDHPLPDSGDYLFANITDLPRLIFRSNRVSHHLARSVLCKTHNALIENNYFHGGTGTAVHIAAEAFWGEGIESENVVVRGNTFRDCGFCGYGRTNGASAVSLNIAAADPTGVGIHKNICIEDNTVTCPPDATYIFNIANAQHVTLRRNRCSGCDKIAAIAYCEDVETDASEDQIEYG